MENEKNNTNFNNNIVTKVPTCCLIEDYWMLRSALDSLLNEDIDAAIESIKCAAQCISDVIEDCTEVAPGLEITPSVSSAIAMSCGNGLLLDGKKDLRCAAGYALSDAVCSQCDNCEFGRDCDPAEGFFLLKGNVRYEPRVDTGGEAFVKNLEQMYPCDTEAEVRKHPLTEIQTPFGVIYIEGKDEADREEPSRVKIFDSGKRYFDYIELEENEAYDDLLSKIRDMTNVEDLLSFIACITRHQLTKDWTVASDILSDEKFHYDSPEALLENEWVNKIGDTYIVFED